MTATIIHRMNTASLNHTNANDTDRTLCGKSVVEGDYGVVSDYDIAVVKVLLNNSSEDTYLANSIKISCKTCLKAMVKRGAY